MKGEKLNFVVNAEEAKAVRETVAALHTTLSQYLRSIICTKGLRLIRIGEKLYDIKDLKEIEVFEMTVKGNGEKQKETVKKA